MRSRAARSVRFLALLQLARTVDDEAVHVVQQVAGELQHLLGSRGKLSGARADCCTSSRILSIARTTACAPEACSSTAELISCVISVRRLVALAICVEPTDCSLVAAPISWENL